MSPALSVHVITEEDPFYLPVFFREFFAHLARDRFTVSGVDLTPPLNQTTRWGLARKLYRFYGLDVARLAGRYATVKALDLLTPRGRWSGTIPRIAEDHGIPCRVVADVNAPAYVERLRELAPDLVLSVAASQIFKSPLLSVPRIGCVNVHTGPLPAYRGMMPVFWQLYDGRRSIKVTVHSMSVDIDLGLVLLEREVALNGERSLDQVIRTMKREGARAVLELLEHYYWGTVQPVAMDRALGRYRSFPGRNEAATLRRMGYRLV